MTKERQKAYATLLEALEIAVEARLEGELHYIVGYDETLYHAKQSGAPVPIHAWHLETLLKSADTLYVVGWTELYEFETVLPAEKVQL